MTPKFVADTKHHQMKVCLDQGLYRHLKFATQPIPYAAPTTGNCSFQIFTTPGSLAIAGDMGTYVFARLEDMFLFFDAPGGRINPDYWSEKVTAQDVHCPVRSFSEAKFRQTVREDYDDRKYSFDPPEQTKLLELINRDILQNADTYHEVGARETLRDFSFTANYHGRPAVVFDYGDSWEWDFRDFSHHFLWCLEAIVFGITRYREATGHV